MDLWRAALTGFPLAGAALTADRDLQQRAESKFVIPAATALALVLALRRQFALLAAGDSLEASYESVYFDTEDLMFYDSQRRGRRVRHKVRVRHYLDRRLTVLEVKIRRAAHDSVKVRQPREFGRVTLLPADLDFVHRAAGPVATLRPQATVAYRRITLLSLQSVERVTIDTHLDVRGTGGRRRYHGAAIVEVKQPRRDHHSSAMALLRLAGARPAWMSKYCTAIAVTTPGVRVSPLTSGLRRLNTVGTWTH